MTCGQTDGAGKSTSEPLKHAPLVCPHGAGKCDEWRTAHNAARDATGHLHDAHIAIRTLERKLEYAEGELLKVQQENVQLNLKLAEIAKLVITAGDGCVRVEPIKRILGKRGDE